MKMDDLQQTASNSIDDTKDAFDDVKDKASDTIDNVKDKASDTIDGVKEDISTKGGEVEGRADQWSEDSANSLDDDDDMTDPADLDLNPLESEDEDMYGSSIL
jgi:hypothetical protein